MNTQQKMHPQKWNNIPWALIEKYVLQIQNRIYYAEKKNDKRHIYLLQKKLSKSWSLQTKIISSYCFLKKKNPNSLNRYTNAKEFFQTEFSFFYNNDNMRDKIFSIFFEKASQNQQKKSHYLNYEELSADWRSHSQTFTRKIINIANLKKTNINLFDKNSLIIYSIIREQEKANLFFFSKKKLNVEKFSLNNLESIKNKKNIFLKKCLEKKIKYLFQIFYLNKDLPNLENPFFLMKPKKDKQIQTNNPIQRQNLNNKMSFLEIKKIVKLAQIKKTIEPQWQARYECYSYSIKRGPSYFNKIKAIYKNICNEPKFALFIEIKNLLFTEGVLFFNFFFYGLEKAFFHTLKKQYIYHSFSEQILIFEKNQIIIVHNNDLFLKKFCQFFFFFIKSFKKNEKKMKSRWKEPTMLDTQVSAIDNFDLEENFYSIKTQIVHSFLPYEKNPPGIDFLGFHINQLNKKQYLQKSIDLEYFKKSVFNDTKFNLQTFITPSLSNIRNHLIQIRTIIKQSKTATQELLINKLSPKIRGWSKFYSRLFFLLDKKKGYQKAANYCDYLTFKMLWRWACRRHPNKNRKWIKLKYFKTLNGKNWVFCVGKKREPELLTKKSFNSNNFFINSEFFYLCLPLHREI